MSRSLCRYKEIILTKIENQNTDLSIAPLNVGANTYSSALLVGSKAAEIVAKELGITLA